MTQASVLDARWMPQTADERTAVLDELRCILQSAAFRNSKRYPALLELIVRQTLEGKGDLLKERTLGVEVFRRLPDYDTSLDPIVRVTAGEVRKRLSQYYDEFGDTAKVRIVLPAGSYAALFSLIPPVQEEVPETSQPGLPLSSIEAGRSGAEPQPSHETSIPRWLPWGVTLAILVVVVAVASLFVHRRDLSARAQFWAPVLSSDAHVLVLISPPIAADLKPADLLPADPEVTTLSEFIRRPAQTMSLADVMAMSRVIGTLVGEGKNWTEIPAISASVSEMHGSTLILVGPTGSVWANRVLETLPFTFYRDPQPVPGTHSHRHYVIDRQAAGQVSPWMVDFSLPLSSIHKDYAVISRFQSKLTDGTVMVVTGIGPMAKIAAARFVTSDEIQALAATAPRDWRKKNMEAVLEVTTLDGHEGHVNVVASRYW